MGGLRQITTYKKDGKKIEPKFIVLSDNII